MPPRKPRLLIVEDEPAIRVGLVDVFVYHGFEVEAVADGRVGLERTRAGDFDLILLDVMLPSLDGFSILRSIRETDLEQAVILLTARSSDEDVIQGLSLGADDYVGKPFSVAQLVLRVQAVLRRSAGPAAEARQLQLGEGDRVDCGNLAARVNGIEVRFTRREMDVLLFLAQHPDRAVSRDELLQQVWGYQRASDIETRTVDIHIAKLRRKIERDAKSPQRLITVRGGGYRLQLG